MLYGCRSMRSCAVREERLAMLSQPHMTSLVAYAEDVAARLSVEVPMFDPADGGVEARILFLKEKPGPKTSTARLGFTGSGFISRDNDDPTAEATYDLMQKIGLDRKQTLMWNVIPGWNGTIKLTDDERRRGLAEMPRLLALLPKLEVVVLVGKQAWKAEPYFANTQIELFKSYHPSRRVQNSYPNHWRSIPAVWAEAASRLR